ncbi:tetratricopeptide repeat protein [Calothrix sp. NIES-3974]|uniref:tetratricopeptide repeat protein n=1 Tax=Calothrix sp. NIES-3974 TaxID=2005462 RepID=UPI000B615F51|nr:tetratricopeptide repeat protein [Calothrix sp. NIES-3974]BAZ05662.1 TPR repeat-containing protein [Calothrix sp. NIES-3974]
MVYPQMQHLTVKTISISWLVLLFTTYPAIAQRTSSPDKFPPNPIELRVKDPLLPNPPKPNQQLTPEEAQRLNTALDSLHQEAIAKYQSGDKVSAYETWNRELRLRKYLGANNEVQALTRVGQIAWSDPNREQVFFITQRLQKILNNATTTQNNDLELWRGLANAFQAVRSPKPALEALAKVLAGVRGTEAELTTLRQIGDLHMSWFDYTNAANTYREILNKITATGDRQSIIANLRQLAYIYDQGKQPQQAVEIKTKLVELYQQENNIVDIPRLRTAIAADLETLAKDNPALLDQAFENYQIAYTIAWQNEQYATAGEVLRQLIALYRKQGQLDDALKTSEILLEAETRAANLYEVMNAYEQIGEIHLQQQNKPQALTAFQKGLEIARILQHNQDYFSQQIQSLSTPPQ